MVIFPGMFKWFDVLTRWALFINLDMQRKASIGSPLSMGVRLACGVIHSVCWFWLHHFCSTLPSLLCLLPLFSSPHLSCLPSLPLRLFPQRRLTPSLRLSLHLSVSPTSHAEGPMILPGFGSFIRTTPDSLIWGFQAGPLPRAQQAVINVHKGGAGSVLTHHHPPTPRACLSDETQIPPFGPLWMAPSSLWPLTPLQCPLD